MKRNKYVLICLLLIVCKTAICQKQIDRKALLLDLNCTVDQLYWNGEEYLIDKSFLSPFNGYKKIYPTIPLVEEMIVYGMGVEPVGHNYYPIWLLQDSVLMLRDIGFFVSRSFIEEEFPNGKQYTILEKLTGQKFQKGNARVEPDTIPKESPVGSMPAPWVNGIFYVKKVRTIELSINKWEQLPFQKLTFKNGKLTSVESFNISSLPPDQK